MRVASICAASALAFGFIHSPALAQNPPPTPLPTISEREEVRNTYIFKFDDSVDRGEMHARAQQAVAGTGGNLRHVYTEVLGGFAATLPSTAVWNVARRPGIVSFERDQIATVFNLCEKNPWHKNCTDNGGGEEPVEEDPVVENPPAEEPACESSYGGTKPWGVTRINAPAAHGPNCGQGTHVYVLDTGIDLDHPDLTPLDGVDCTQSGCPSGGEDKNGHGTHVAGTIAARINNRDVVGVAPAAHLHAVQVLGPSGRGSFTDIIAGINYVAGQADPNSTTGGPKLGPVVANLSLGGSDPKKAGTCSSGEFTGDDALHQAMCEAAAKGVVFVVAAGNSGADAEDFVPAAYDDTVITVSATDKENQWPTWSNWGTPVVIAAPGASILSTAKGGGTTTMSGTSMASPHVAGVAALLLQEKYEADVTAGTDNPGYPASYDAFVTVRQDMLARATATPTDDGSFDNDRHDEKFACAVQGCP